MPVNAVAKQVGEHDTRLWRILKHYVKEARTKADYSSVRKIGIDETSAKMGHAKKQQKKLESLKYENLDTVKAYNIKLSLRSFFGQPDRKAGEEFLKRWYFWATHSRLVPIVKAAYTIKDHWEGILNWFSSRITNGLLEGLNSLIQAAKARAKGKFHYNILHNCQ
ncbi:hypothetical protein H0A61_00576 [Koleobacter methoxysyntrophicus]|uniref:Transposase IS204/IS1001/IS1096/IS1165 DDE domain-containing protein n=1 Tax=Koleobacter methoxysyntrophicus TaxID=2751313 RepID=A0A8A0RM20_9FIRM|nr:hypothetical protein H0A61_00576 [Koleobacter methoxysyntrophicus]